MDNTERTRRGEQFRRLPAGPNRFSLAQLKEFGVRRVSIGTSFCRTGPTAVVRAAREVLDQGSFDYVEGIHTVAEFNDLIDPRAGG